MKSLHTMLGCWQVNHSDKDLRIMTWKAGRRRETKRYEARQGKYGIYANWTDLFFE